MLANQSFAVPDSTKRHFFHFSNILKDLKNPFKKNTVKYIDTISAKSVSFHLNEENSKVRKVTTYPVPVGFNDFEENLIDMQLLGKISAENSFTNRPYYLNTYLTYDSLLKLIDTSIKYRGYLIKKKKFEVRLTPLNILQKYTSDHPFGYNDGPLNYSNGYQFLVSGGIAMRWKFISFQIRPEFFKTASNFYEHNNNWGSVVDPLKLFIPGQSSINIHINPFILSISSQNLWTGPGYSNSLILSNNAQGFKHINIKNIKPLKTIFGDFEFNIISGILERLNNQINEVAMDKFTYPSTYPNSFYYNSQIPLPEKKYYNLINFNYSPKFIPYSYWGFQRVFQNYLPANSYSKLNFINEYLPVLNGIFRTTYTDDNFPRDQKLAFYSKFIFPKDMFNIYFEFAYNDGVVNFRDLILRSQRSSSYLFGFNKSYILKNKNFINIKFETIRLAELPNYLISSAGTFYQHGLILGGYTQFDQIIGAGVGNGNNAQELSFSLSNGFKKYTFRFEHISQGFTNNSGDFFSLGIRPTLWDDYLFGISSNYKIFDNLLLKSQFNFVNSRNYLWKKGNNHNNLFLLLNLIYLW